MSEIITESFESRVAVLRLNAPEKRNAISLEMREALIERLNQCFMRDDCDGVVIAGEGGHFSAGGDIKNTRPAQHALARSLRHNLSRLHEMVRLVMSAPKPVVAAVQGKAYGAGMSLAIACDVVVATDDAEFCAAFGKIGLVPDAGMLYTLPRRVGPSRAQHLMLSARAVPAHEAHQMGLVDRVVPPSELLTAALDEVQRLVAIAPLAFAAIKSVARSGFASLEDAFAEELRLNPLLAMTHDNQEARSAFAERRRPAYKGY